MNKQAIKKLRRKFTLVSFISFMAVMIIISMLIFFVDFYSITKQIHSVLNYIVENGGDISENNYKWLDNKDFTPENEFDKTMENFFGTGIDTSPEMRFFTRYFSVWFTDDGEFLTANISNIASVTEKKAEQYGRKALRKNIMYGSEGHYFYKMVDMEGADGVKLIVFLDCTQHLNSLERLMNIILILVAFGGIVMYLLVYIISKHMIKPEIRNAERQKQFITNAGHELKTPLAVIRANTELDMMINGENEWNTSTLRQTDNMTKLIQNLILIARADEKPNEEHFVDTDVSAEVREAVESLSSIAQQSEKKMETDIADGIMMKANKGQINQLAALLIDNAIKYCDEKGTIKTTLSLKGKNIRLVVSNDYKDGEGVDCNRFFDRFYREDKSHNSDKGGYGIGLSIAESIVKMYKGTIHANYNNGVISFICLLRP